MEGKHSSQGTSRVVHRGPTRGMGWEGAGAGGSSSSATDIDILREKPARIQSPSWDLLISSSDCKAP